MNNTEDRAPASVTGNVEKVIRVESETLRPRSRGEAITDKVGGFVGTISFVIAQIAAFHLDNRECRDSTAGRSLQSVSVSVAAAITSLKAVRLQPLC